MKIVKKTLLTLIVIYLNIIYLYGSTVYNYPSRYDSLSQQDKNQLEKTVIIGSQTWMTENLSVTEFRNGDTIHVFTTYEEWLKFGKEKTPACADYHNDHVIGKTTGKLYNWYAVNDPRGLCPEGFRVPTEDDFSILLTFIGGEEYNSEVAQKELAEGGSSGFDALFGGWCCMDYTDEDTSFFFINFSSNAAFWSSTETGNNEALNLDIGTTWRSDSYGAYLDPSSSKELAFSVRCIKE